MKHIRQAGIISLVAAILLVTGVLTVILLTTNIIRSRSIDTARTSDSTAAFMIAESGLERAQAVISGAITSAAASDSTCTGFLTDGPFSIGRGTLSYSQATSSPPSCGTTTACTGCSITAKGVVGSSERDLSLDVEYGTQDGVTGRGTVVKMILKNTFSTDAIALFNLAWRRQGTGGNASSTLTTCASCTLMWNLNSSSGLHSAGGMGTAVPISANTFSQVVTQTLDFSRDFTEVGGLFPGLTSAPTKLAAYWSDGSEGAGATYTTFSNNAATTSGVVRAGAATSSLATCSTPSNPPGNNGDYQSCTSWCYGGDTLIMGYSARSATVADHTTAAHFDTAGNNIAMNFLVHYPNTDGTTANASGEEYAEIYWAYNPAYSSSSDPANSSFSGAGATSYTAAVIGAAGATLSFPNSSKIGNGSTTGTFTSVTGYQACVGDTIVDGNLQAGTTITSLKQHSSGTPVTCVSAGTGLSIDIAISKTSTGNVTSPSVQSTSLHTSATTANLAAGSATVLAGGTITIASGPDASGIYTLSTPATVASGYIVQGSGTSTTIKVASASELPSTISWTDSASVSHNTIVRVYKAASGGTGAFAANTTITAIDSVNKTFTISAAPSTALVGATVCAGTCAYFNTPGSTTAVTNFSISPTATSTSQWSAGFMCLAGVNPAEIQKVTSTAITSRNWAEAVQ